MGQPIEFKTKKQNPHFDQVVDIEPAELDTMRSLVKIIDVRQPEEYTGELGHIPEAELVVLDQLPENLNKFSNDHTYVIVCRSGGRSARASAFLMENGIKNIYNLKGGMLLWNTLLLPTKS